MMSDGHEKSKLIPPPEDASDTAKKRYCREVETTRKINRQSTGASIHLPEYYLKYKDLKPGDEVELIVKKVN